MRFLLLLRMAEAQGAPPAELFDAITQHGEEMSKAGILLDTAGLAPNAMASRVGLRGGKLSVTDGPFTETKEMIASYALIQVKTKEEAIELARRFMEIHQQYWPGWEGESEVRQVFGPEDWAAQPPGAAG